MSSVFNDTIANFYLVDLNIKGITICGTQSPWSFEYYRMYDHNMYQMQISIQR